MAADAKEPVFSMATTRHSQPCRSPASDPPLPAPAFRASHQPAVDHLRERLVMSLRTLLGPRQPVLSERPKPPAYSTRNVLRVPVNGRAAREPAPVPTCCARLDATFAQPRPDQAACAPRSKPWRPTPSASSPRTTTGILVVDNGVVSDERAPAVAARIGRQSTNGSSPPAGATGPASSPSPTTPTTCTTSPRSSATAPTPSARASPRDRGGRRRRGRGLRLAVPTSTGELPGRGPKTACLKVNVEDGHLHGGL